MTSSNIVTGISPRKISGEGGLMRDGMLGANTAEEAKEGAANTDSEEDDEDHEEALVKRAPNPSDPTPEERERHNATHRPFRSWCPVCVKAIGREDAHYARTAEERKEGLPQISMDYATITEQEKAEDGTIIVNTKTILGGTRQMDKVHV